MKTLVIIPAYNEEQTIGQVIRSIKQHFPEADILVVNDGSTDHTGAIAKASGLAAVVDLPANLGIGGAVQTGYLYADRRGYDLAVQIDADGQHDPQELARVCGEVLSGKADCAIGSRFVSNTGYRGSLARRIGIGFFSWMVWWMCGLRIADPTSGFRAVNRKVIRLFGSDYPDDYPEVEAIVRLAQQGYKVAEVPVRMHGRQAGRSSITPFRTLYYMAKVSLALMITRIRDVS